MSNYTLAAFAALVQNDTVYYINGDGTSATPESLGEYVDGKYVVFDGGPLTDKKDVARLAYLTRKNCHIILVALGSGATCRDYPNVDIFLDCTIKELRSTCLTETITV